MISRFSPHGGNDTRAIELLGFSQMTRTTKYRLTKALAIVGISMVGLALLYMSGFSFWLFIFLVMLLASPALIQARSWRDYMRGQHLLAKKKHLEAIVFFERFLEKIRRRPELKKLIWLNASPYTRDVEVMALVNLGVCRLQTNELKKAEAAFTAARELDPDSPLPYYNLALTSQARDKEEQAREHLDKAEALGFKRTSIDRVRDMLND